MTMSTGLVTPYLDHVLPPLQGFYRHFFLLIIDISIIMITHHRPTDYHYHCHNLAQYDGGLVAIPDNYFEYW